MRHPRPVSLRLTGREPDTPPGVVEFARPPVVCAGTARYIPGSVFRKAVVTVTELEDRPALCTRRD